MFSAFCLANVLRATAACHFWTCELQKVVRTRQFFSIFTCKCAFRHSRVQCLHIATSKMAPPLWCFVHFDLQMCFSPQPRAIFEHRNVQNAPPMWCFAFWLANVLRATAACNFWTSQQNGSAPVVFFHILTYKYASRHSGVQFVNIVTSKMAPPPWCFPHFDLQICFSPQRRAIFEHRNVQNGSAPVVFSTFWLTNMLRATAACHFSPVCQNSYLRTRRFSEATFRTSATTNHWKNTAIRDFTNIFRACWTPCYWLCTPVDLLAPDSTHMLIFLLLTWLLCDSSLQLYILSEVRLLNFLR